jgi:hypothetical protein
MDYKEFNAEFSQMKAQYENSDKDLEVLNQIHSLINNAKEEISEKHPEILSMGYLWLSVCEAYDKMTNLAQSLAEEYFPVIDNERPYRWRTDIHLDYNNKAIVLDIDLGDEIKPVNLAALKESLGNPEYRLMLNETARHPTVKFVCNIANTDISNIGNAEKWMQDAYKILDDIPPIEESEHRTLRR